MAVIDAIDEGAIAFWILDLIGRMPSVLEAPLVDYFTGKASLVLTNVPGPAGRASRRRARRRVLVWAPCSGSVEMSVSLLSYAGEVTVGRLVNAATHWSPSRSASPPMFATSGARTGVSRAAWPAPESNRAPTRRTARRGRSRSGRPRRAA